MQSCQMFVLQLLVLLALLGSEASAFPDELTKDSCWHTLADNSCKCDVCANSVKFPADSQTYVSTYRCVRASKCASAGSAPRAGSELLSSYFNTFELNATLIIINMLLISIFLKLYFEFEILIIQSVMINDVHDFGISFLCGSFENKTPGSLRWTSPSRLPEAGLTCHPAIGMVNNKHSYIIYYISWKI